MIWWIIPIMALLHRLRGGLIKLPFDIKYACPPLAGLAYWGLGAWWPAALVWAIGYLLWIIPGYMDEIDEALGITPSGQVTSHNWTVSFVEFASFDNPILSVYIRAAVYFVPLCIAMPYVHQNPVWLLIPILTFWPAYLIGFNLRPDVASVAEPIVGASVGLAMALAATYLPIYM